MDDDDFDMGEDFLVSPSKRSENKLYKQRSILDDFANGFVPEEIYDNNSSEDAISL